MFNFLFRRRAGAEPEVVAETQRETITRALDEVNGVLALLDPKPAVTFDPANGTLSLDLPEHMPDEALALPAPEPEASEEKPAETSEEGSAQNSEERS